MSEHVLVVGATGVVGQAALRHFGKRGECRVTAVSRREPPELFGARFHALDLTDARACAELTTQLSDVTRVVYAALFEKPGLYAGWFESDQIQTNRQMLANVFDPLARAATGLRHVTLLQGTKAYGAHVGRIASPAREDRDEARDVPNFYWEQESYLRSKRAGASWCFSILRPQLIFGMSIGAPMNLIPAIGVYAALRRERGEALAYPGGVAPVMEAVDADLLAAAIDWVGSCPAARDQIFNVTNGDVFSWQAVWPAIADALRMRLGEHEPDRLGESMPARSGEWDAVRAKYGLRSPRLAEFVGESFHYADFTMAHGVESPLPPVLLSTVKLRQAGFREFMDTEAMFRKWLALFEDQELLPRSGAAACNDAKEK